MLYMYIISFAINCVEQLIFFNQLQFKPHTEKIELTKEKMPNNEIVFFLNLDSLSFQKMQILKYSIEGFLF